MPPLTQTISCVSHIMSCWSLGLHNKSLVEEFCLVDVVASGSVLPIPEAGENTYYDDDETTERVNDEDIWQYYYELGCTNSQLSEGVIKLQ